MTHSCLWKKAHISQKDYEKIREEITKRSFEKNAFILVIFIPLKATTITLFS